MMQEVGGQSPPPSPPFVTHPARIDTAREGELRAALDAMHGDYVQKQGVVMRWLYQREARWRRFRARPGMEARADAVMLGLLRKWYEHKRMAWDDRFDVWRALQTLRNRLYWEHTRAYFNGSRLIADKLRLIRVGRNEAARRRRRGLIC